MRTKSLLCFLLPLLVFIALPALAEIYKGVGPYDTLSDLKGKFPGATFNKIQPAWAQEYDVMYQITGVGLSGTIIVKFHDSRPLWKTMLEKTDNESLKEAYRKMAERPDEDVVVSWVRWVPDLPFSVTRLITKYGKPDKDDFSEENYQPYKQWDAKGIIAYLSDDGKQVVRIDFFFTDKELKDTYKAKFGYELIDPNKPNSKIKKVKKNK